MKKLLIVIALGLTWYLYEPRVGTNNHTEFSTTNNAEFSTTNSVERKVVEYDPEPYFPEPKPKEQFKCDGRQYCSDMTSKAEAEFFNQNCPDTKMDGDHDGEPCENDSRWR